MDSASLPLWRVGTGTPATDSTPSSLRDTSTSG
ncbi:hypothetical protein OKW31_002416 [Paraburkholderia atlantica]